MKSRPVTVASVNSTSTPAKRTLFRTALAIAMIGTLAVSTISILHGGLTLIRFRYFVDIGLHPLHVTSVYLLFVGLLSLFTFLILTLGLVKVNRTFVIIAAILSGMCSFGLIALSIWSFFTITSGHLPTSINSAIVKELDQTQYSVASGNNLIIDNTVKMARLEKQHHCCGLTDPIEDYRGRQPAIYGSLNPSSSSLSSFSSSSSSSSGNNRGRISSTQRNTAAFGSAVHLPISCCNEKYRSPDNLCIDMFGNNTNLLSRYNTDGCYAIAARDKYERIERQGFTTIVSACLAVISCIALAAVLRLMNEGYQIIPLRTPM
jgi:hypothetical protein